MQPSSLFLRQGVAGDASMPAGFRAFGREDGRHVYAARDGQPYVELSGTAAILLVICPGLFVSIEAETLMPYATFWQLFRFILVASSALLRRRFKDSLLNVGGPASVILDRLLQLATSTNDTGVCTGASRQPPERRLPARELEGATTPPRTQLLPVTS